MLCHANDEKIEQKIASAHESIESALHRAALLRIALVEPLRLSSPTYVAVTSDRTAQIYSVDYAQKVAVNEMANQ